jgi:hypothetical protein
MSGSPDTATTSTIAVRAVTDALRAGGIALPTGTAAQEEELNKALNESLLTVSKEGILFTARLETTIFKPARAGPRGRRCRGVGELKNGLLGVRPGLSGRMWPST